MIYQNAKAIADKYLELFKPFCERIEIAGSIRRKSKQCGDIELVLIPKKVVIRDLFEAVSEEPCKEFVELVNSLKKIKGDPLGKYMQRETPEGMTLDIFTANASNWGYIYLIRTGSSDFSKRMAVRWVRLGYRGHEGMLHRGDTQIVLREEEDFFNVLEMRYVPPENRD